MKRETERQNTTTLDGLDYRIKVNNKILSFCVLHSSLYLEANRIRQDNNSDKIAVLYSILRNTDVGARGKKEHSGGGDSGGGVGKGGGGDGWGWGWEGGQVQIRSL